MATKGKNGKGSKGGGGKNHDDSTPSDYVIEFTPDAGFDIRSAAMGFSTMMEDLGQDLIIHLPHVSIEFEVGCSPQEIIDGYKQGIEHKYALKPSNNNNIKPPKR